MKPIRLPQPDERSRRAEWLVLVLIAAWVIYNLAFLTKTGFISDDAYNAQIKGKIIQEGTTLNFRILDEVMGWLRGSGRIMLLTWYMTYGLYYFVHDPLPIKLINIALVTGGVLLFYRFTKKETGSTAVATVAALLMPTFFQMRIWHDPILAFTFLMPISFALVMGALVLFQDALDRESRARMVLAACIYFASLLMYEIAYPLCLLFVAAAFSRHRKPVLAIRQSLPFTVPVALLAALSAAIRLYFIKAGYTQSSYPGADLHLEPLALLHAFGIQTLASFPLSYLLFARTVLPLELHPKDYLVLAAWAVALSFALYRLRLPPVPPRLGGWALAGLILLLVPAALTALSGHQSELIAVGPGFGYIPVYLQYFGLCILAVCAWALLARTLRSRHALILLSALVGCGLAAVTGANLALNRAVAQNTNETYKYPRDLLQAALQAGLTEPMGKEATLLRVMRYASDYTWFYSLNTGKRFHVCDLSDRASYGSCVARIGQRKADHPAPAGAGRGVVVQDWAGEDAWVLSYNVGRSGERTGRVVLGRIRTVVLNADTGTLVQLVTDRVRIYEQASRTVREADDTSAPLNFLRVIEREAVTADQATPLADPAFQAGIVDFEWLDKIYPREGNEEHNVRWSSGRGTLTLHNMSTRPQRVRIAMAFATPTPAPSHLTVTRGQEQDSLVLGPTLAAYVRELTLPPGQTHITFSSDARPIANGDPRSIVFGIFNFKLQAAGQAGRRD